MKEYEESPQPRLVLICAPVGRDDRLMSEALYRADIASRSCGSVQEVCEAIQRDEAGMALLAEEALSAEAAAQLRDALQGQPPWSDLPLLVLTSGGRSTEASLLKMRRLSILGNITLLERPLRSVTLLAAVRSALASRERQWQTRNYVRQLQETQARLGQANDDLKQFAFAASHDLQEPLRMVSIFTQLLLDRYVDSSREEARQFGEYVRKGVSRIEALLHDLLHYSRAIHEDNSETMVSFDLADALRDARHALQIEIEARQADIVAGPLPVVSGNPMQISLVFQNLLSNSLKYAQDHMAPQVRISAEQEGNEYRIRVQDNGIGFDQQYAERIFDLFQRLGDTKAAGTGLGLAICRRIIERHGGRMWAESQRGVGSTFFFTLPARESRG